MVKAIVGANWGDEGKGKIGITINGIENYCLAHSLYRFIFLLSTILCIVTVLLNAEKPCNLLKNAVKYTS